VCERCSYLLIASASSMAGSLLVEIFGFPLVTTLQMGHMCFVTALATGNWGMEVSIFLYAQLPSFAPALPLRPPSLSSLSDAAVATHGASRHLSSASLSTPRKLPRRQRRGYARSISNSRNTPSQCILRTRSSPIIFTPCFSIVTRGSGKKGLAASTRSEVGFRARTSRIPRKRMCPGVVWA
jgi:hypothetical protein